MKCCARTKTARRASLKRAAIHFVFVALLTGSALSQETTLHSQSNVVVIPALVKSAKGEAVYGLTAKDFLVEDDGVEQTAHLDDAAEGQPVSMVIAIQRGRRANYEFPRIRGLGAMLDPLLEDGRGSAAIVEFDSQVQTAQEFTGSSEKIAWTLKELQPGDGGAAILDALDYSETPGTGSERTPARSAIDQRDTRPRQPI
jgi:hypothetical protein